MCDDERESAHHSSILSYILMRLFVAHIDNATVFGFTPFV